MFDFAWSEFGVIAVVALILIGPKDIPVAIKAVSGTIKKARRMAGEFQSHVDEMVREADLQEVRDHLGDLRNFSIGRTIEKFVDDDGTLRRAFNDDPPGATATGFEPSPAPAVVPLDQVFVGERQRPLIDAAPEPAPDDARAAPSEPSSEHAPDFIPPPCAHLARPPGRAGEMPAFIPPGCARPAPAPLLKP